MVATPGKPSFTASTLSRTVSALSHRNVMVQLSRCLEAKEYGLHRSIHRLGGCLSQASTPSATIPDTVSLIGKPVS